MRAGRSLSALRRRLARIALYIYIEVRVTGSALNRCLIISSPIGFLRRGYCGEAKRTEQNQNGYSITSAPLYYDGIVYSGIAGGEYGTRGRLTALDAKTGKIIPFKEFSVARNDGALAPYLQRAQVVKLFRDKKLMPAGVCATTMDPRSKKCAVCAECFSGKFMAQQDAIA